MRICRYPDISFIIFCNTSYSCVTDIYSQLVFYDITIFSDNYNAGLCANIDLPIVQSYSVGNIKFSGSGSPDVLDEARVELEWMFNMIVSSSDPYWGSKCSGLVYHKMHDHKWTGLATKPYDYQEDWGTTRIVKPPTYAATFNMIACAAQAARLWKDFDSSFSEKCLKNAKSSWEAMMAKKNSWYGVDHGADAWKTDPQ